MYISYFIYMYIYIIYTCSEDSISVILHSIKCDNSNNNNSDNNYNNNSKNNGVYNNSTFWGFSGFAIILVLFFCSREEFQPMHVLFISLLKGELTVKYERFNLAF